MKNFKAQSFYAIDMWRPQISFARLLPAHTEIMIPSFGMPHPLEAGFVSSIGDAAGQKANYRLPLEDGTEAHVKEFEDHYTLHWDMVSAINNPVGHIFWDATHWVVLGLIGAAILGIVSLALRDN